MIEKPFLNSFGRVLLLLGCVVPCLCDNTSVFKVSLPAVTTGGTVHALAVKGASSWEASTTQSGLSYTEGIVRDEEKAWGNRNYVLSGVMGMEAEGTTYLRPSLVKEVKLGTNIEVTVTSSSPTAELVVYLFVVNDQRNGGWTPSSLGQRWEQVKAPGFGWKNAGDASSREFLLVYKRVICVSVEVAMPPTTTGQTVHGFALLGSGVRGWRGDATQGNLKYSQGSLKDGEQIWNNRDYVFSGVEGTELAGATYLRPTLHKEIGSNTEVTITTTVTEGSDAVLYLFVIDDSRNGGWPTSLDNDVWQPVSTPRTFGFPFGSTIQNFKVYKRRLLPRVMTIEVSMPPTSTGQTVHGFALFGNGIRSWEAVSTQVDLKYSTTAELKDGEQVWDNRHQYVFSGVAGTEFAGATYLRPTLHKEIRSNTEITISATVTEWSDAALYLFVIDDSRNGGWPTSLDDDVWQPVSIPSFGFKDNAGNFWAFKTHKRSVLPQILLPPTTTGQTVHGLALTGALDWKVSATQDNLKYRAGTVRDEETAWGDRHYVLSGVAGMEAEGATYLQPSLVKGIGAGTRITVTVAHHRPWAPVALYLFVVKDWRNGGWTPPRLGQKWEQVDAPAFGWKDPGDTSTNEFLSVYKRVLSEGSPVPETWAPTSAPATGAPPTKAPPTPHPATAAPPTKAPATAAPPTRAPDTMSPSTPAPLTPAPGPVNNYLGEGAGADYAFRLNGVVFEGNYTGAKPMPCPSPPVRAMGELTLEEPFSIYGTVLEYNPCAGFGEVLINVVSASIEGGAEVEVEGLFLVRQGLLRKLAGTVNGTDDEGIVTVDWSGELVGTVDTMGWNAEAVVELVSGGVGTTVVPVQGSRAAVTLSGALAVKGSRCDGSAEGEITVSVNGVQGSFDGIVSESGCEEEETPQPSEQQVLWTIAGAANGEVQAAGVSLSEAKVIVELVGMQTDADEAQQVRVMLWRGRVTGRLLLGTGKDVQMVVVFDDNISEVTTAVTTHAQEMLPSDGVEGSAVVSGLFTVTAEEGVLVASSEGIDVVAGNGELKNMTGTMRHVDGTDRWSLQSQVEKASMHGADVFNVFLELEGWVGSDGAVRWSGRAKCNVGVIEDRGTEPGVFHVDSPNPLRATVQPAAQFTFDSDSEGKKQGARLGAAGLHLSATSAEVSVAPGDWLARSGQAFTATVWVRRRGGQTRDTTLLGAEGFSLVLHGDNTLSIFLKLESRVVRMDATRTPLLRNYMWAYIVLSYDGARRVQLFVHGLLVETWTLQGVLTWPASRPVQVVVGARSDRSSSWEEDIDEVRFFPAALGEVAVLVSAGRVVPTTPPPPQGGFGSVFAYVPFLGYYEETSGGSFDYGFAEVRAGAEVVVSQCREVTLRGAVVSMWDVASVDTTHVLYRPCAEDGVVLRAQVTGRAGGTEIKGNLLHGVEGDVTRAANGTWGGVMTGTTDALWTPGMTASAIVLATSDIKVVATAQAADDEFVRLSGEVTLQGLCGRMNEGVDLLLAVESVPGLRATVDVAQDEAGCGQRPPQELWHTLPAPVVGSVPVDGLLLSQVSVDAVQEPGGRWLVRVFSELQFSPNTSLALRAEFERHQQQARLRAFFGDGSFEAGVVRSSGEARFDIADGLASATSVPIDLVASNAELRNVAADVVRVLQRRSSNEALPVWQVTARGQKGKLFGLPLRDLQLDLVGVEVNTTGRVEVVWTGSISGKGDFSTAVVEVSGRLEADGTVSPLEGPFVATKSEVAFVGSVEVDNADPGCFPFQVPGVLTVPELGNTEGGTTFDGGLQYNGCASKVGDPLFAFSGETLQQTLEVVPGFVMKKVASKLEIYVSGTEGGVLSSNWGGFVLGNSNLFNGTSKARIGFVDSWAYGFEVSTAFRSANGTLQAVVDATWRREIFGRREPFEEVFACDGEKATGTATDVVLQVGGAAPLRLAKGTTTFDWCTGVMVISGQTSTEWDSGLTGVLLPGATVVLESTPAEPSAALGGERQWTGNVTGPRADGVSPLIPFDTHNPEAAAAATESLVTDYFDMHVSLSAGEEDGCIVGTGVLVLKNLPRGVQDLELAVQYERCTGGDGWTLTGSLGTLDIPFFGKVLEVDGVEVSYDSSTKTIDFSGTFVGLQTHVTYVVGSGELEVEAKFGSGGDGISPDELGKRVLGGKEAFPSPLRAPLEKLFDGLTALRLQEGRVAVHFNDRAVTAEGRATLFDALEVSVAVRVQKHRNRWTVALVAAVDAVGENMGEVPDLLRTVFSAVSHVSLSLSSTRLESFGEEERTVPRGLSIFAQLSLATVLGDVPPSFRDVTMAKGPVVGVLGTIASPRQLYLDVLLLSKSTGSVIYITEENKNLAISELWLSLSIGTSTSLGFVLGIDFSIGGRPFQVSGRVTAVAGSIQMSLAVDSHPRVWNEPFGIPGVGLVFPMGFGVSVGVPTAITGFQLIGGARVAGGGGNVVLSADLNDFGRSAFRVDVHHLDLQRVLVDVAQCQVCVRGVGRTLTAVSLDKGFAVFNPTGDTVKVSLGAVEEEIEDGIRVEVEGLDLWGVLVINKLRLELDTKGGGFLGFADAQPLIWGPLVVTAGTNDDTVGPQVDIELREGARRIHVAGAARVLGREIALHLSISDYSFLASGRIDFGGGALTAALEVRSEGIPNTRGFRSSIRGEVTTGLAALGPAASKFLDEANEKAKRDLDAGRRSFNSAADKAREAANDLRRARDAALGEVRSWKRKVEKAKRDVQSIRRRCDHYKSGCGGWFPKWRCVLYPGCVVVQKSAEGFLDFAIKTLEGKEAILKAGFKGLEKVLERAATALEKATVVFDAAKLVSKGFFDMLKASANALSNVFVINHIGFLASTTSENGEVSFYFDAIIAGRAFSGSFRASVDYNAVFDYLKGFIADRIKGRFPSIKF